jgi:hypothetical protein
MSEAWLCIVTDAGVCAVYSILRVFYAKHVRGHVFAIMQVEKSIPRRTSLCDRAPWHVPGIGYGLSNHWFRILSWGKRE